MHEPYRVMHSQVCSKYYLSIVAQHLTMETEVDALALYTQDIHILVSVVINAPPSLITSNEAIYNIMD